MSMIYLIRHAEKRDDQGNRGVDETGAHDDESLTPRGWQRAGALAAFFGAHAALPLPDRIYAAAAIKEKIAPGKKVGSNSQRPKQTVSPLAARNNLKIIDKFTKGQEVDLARELHGLSGSALVCWQHEAIPEIAIHLGTASPPAPKCWPDARFDVIWRFSRTGDGPWIFDQICPQLLAGDSKDPIKRGAP